LVKLDNIFVAIQQPDEFHDAFEKFPRSAPRWAAHEKTHTLCHEEKVL
jgi:hypothetical protein